MTASTIFNTSVFSAIAILVLIIYIICHEMYTGWIDFKIEKLQNIKIVDLPPEKVSKLKFRNCVLTLVSHTGETKTFNVEYVLNAMVSAYEGNKEPNYKFKLDDPGLSVYSFQLPGFNDDKTKPDPSMWDDNPISEGGSNTTVTLVGKYKLGN